MYILFVYSELAYGLMISGNQKFIHYQKLIKDSDNHYYMIR